MNKDYKYDAFISYRHCDLDKYVAKNLHKILETYELPKNVKEKLQISGRTIKRVFRDQDELPLSSNLEDPIIEALNDSKYLIVICSPRLKESLWCKKEIETFKKIRGRKNIFCVLIEGEPEDSFPSEVLFDEIETKDKNGKKKIEKKPVEPLAADVRGANNKEVLKKLKTEKLRLIAPMYNLDYDDLKQRHKQRKIRKIIFTSIIAASVCFLFALYSLLMLLKISSQQKTLKMHQALSLAEDSKEYLNSDSRYKAIKSSYEALTKFKGVKMPYTAEAEYALSESLDVYNAGLSYKAKTELETKGVVDFIKISYDNNYVISLDESEELTLWDVNKLKKIKTYTDINAFSFSKFEVAFVGPDKFAYINKDGGINIASTKNGKILKEIKKVKYSFTSIKSDKDGKYLIINDSPNLYLYDANNYKELSKITVKDKIVREMFNTFDGSKLFITTTKGNLDPFKPGNLTMHVLDSSNLNELDSFAIDSTYIEYATEKNDVIYFLTNQSIGTNYDAYITSYDFKNNKVIWTKKIDNIWAKNMEVSAYENAHNLAVSSGNEITILDEADGKVLGRYSLTSNIIEIFVSTSADTYIVFTENGTVYFISLKYNDSIIYKGLFQLNAGKYISATLTNKGYLLVPNNDNRIIYYEKSGNKKAKKIDMHLGYLKDQGLKTAEIEEVKKTFNLKKKNLVKKALYDNKKNKLFVSYTDDTLAVYSVKDKRYINMIENISYADHYFGIDKEGRTYIGNSVESYILDENYNKVGHISGLNMLDKKNDKVIIKDGENSYELPIYYLDDLLNEAKDYLNK